MPWICWVDPSRSGTPHDASCWHEIPNLRVNRESENCLESMSADETPAWADTAGVQSGEKSENDDDICLRSSTHSTPASGWTFAFGGPDNLWISASDGRSWQVRPGESAHATSRVQPAAPPVLLPFEAPRRPTCALFGWLAQLDAGRWSWKWSPCAESTPFFAMRTPAVRPRERLPLRVRLVAEAINHLAEPQDSPAMQQRNANWGVFFSFRLDFFGPNTVRGNPSSMIEEAP
jgi:hypothetical protein